MKRKEIGQMLGKHVEAIFFNGDGARGLLQKNKINPFKYCIRLDDDAKYESVSFRKFQVMEMREV